MFMIFLGFYSIVVDLSWKLVKIDDVILVGIFNSLGCKPFRHWLYLESKHLHRAFNKLSPFCCQQKYYKESHYLD